ncbi:hypothetical protein P7K49_036322 [Saguinus oedipus]|uniref:Uncharacterized protein n=1 Tax=Saguinus oedipus TaxID=9490 RepID=A0ABQ9TJS4_SAGOE|nr:hypothetical protein P7K49_036322 [Saguinus oedipus]
MAKNSSITGDSAYEVTWTQAQGFQLLIQVPRVSLTIGYKATYSPGQKYHPELKITSFKEPSPPMA